MIASIALVLLMSLLAILVYRERVRLGDSSGDASTTGALSVCLMVCLITMGLMRAGGVSTINISLLLTVSCFLTYWGALRQKAQLDGSQQMGPAGLSGRLTDSMPMVVAAVVVVLVVYCNATFPTYYLLGGRDPGLYLIFTTEIAQHGQLSLEKVWLEQVPQSVRDVVQAGFPGIYSAADYGLEGRRDVLIPQFHHLFPSVASVGYMIAGLEGVVRVNAVLFGLGLMAFWAAGRKLSSPIPAGIVTLFLAVNPAMVWAARSTLTEILTFTLMSGGLFLVLHSIDRKSWLLSALAGLAFGLAVFARIDGVLLGALAAGICLSVAMFGNRVQLRYVRATALVYAAVGTLGLLDGFWHSTPYYMDLWKSGASSSLLSLHVFCCLVILLTLSNQCNRALHSIGSAIKPNLGALGRVSALLLGLVFLYLYFVRPETNSDEFSLRAFREIAWYISAGYLLVPLYFLSRLDERRAHCVWLALGVFSVLSLLLFTIHPAITPDHFWASRRWVPVVIPLTLLMSTVLFQDAIRQKLLPIMLCLFIVPSYLYQAYSTGRLFYFESMLDGYIDGYGQLVEQLESHETEQERRVIGFTSNQQLASILTYVFDRPTVLAKPHQFISAERSNAGEDWTGVFIGQTSFFQPLRSVSENRLCGDYPELRKAALPSKLFQRCYNTTISVYEQISSGSISRSFGVTPELFHSQVGRFGKASSKVEATGDKGWLLYGPYIELPPGDYEVTFEFGSITAPEGTHLGSFDAVVDKGRVRLAQQRILAPESPGLEGGSSTMTGRLEFSLAEEADDAEFRVYVMEGVTLAVSGVRLTGSGTQP